MNRYLYITLLAVLGWNAESTAQNGTRQVPRLVVNITIDQLRSDFLEAYAPLYCSDGFRKLMEQGTVYENASYPMQQTDRASAVSTVITGSVPYFHSIIGQRWINRATLLPQRCTEDIRQNDAPSPVHLSVSTLGDELKVATHGEARVFAIAPFCDTAVLSAGHAADGALWLDEQTGQWTTTKYYSNQTETTLLNINKLNESHHCHIIHFSPDYPYQLRLRKPLLKVKAAKHTPGRAGLVVLDKHRIYSGLRHIPGGIGFHKISPGIPVNCRRNHAQAGNSFRIPFNRNLSHLSSPSAAFTF